MKWSQVTKNVVLLRYDTPPVKCLRGEKKKTPTLFVFLGFFLILKPPASGSRKVRFIKKTREDLSTFICILGECEDLLSHDYQKNTNQQLTSLPTSIAL